MQITKLSVQFVRSHDQFVLDLSPEVTVLVGQNGAGKTSLLEAIYIGLLGTSFRGTDKEVLQNNQDWWRIDLKDAEENVRSILFDYKKQSGKKKIIINDSVSYRMKLADKYPVVLFEPDDLQLLSGSPTRRRNFIDRMISQMDPLYSSHLRRYERALKQRNTLLKSELATGDDFFPWNISLSEHGAYIIERRIQVIEQLNYFLTDEYRKISQNDDVISLHYSNTYIGDVRGKMLSELEDSFSRDKILGYTSVGPHRHDFVSNFNDAVLSSVASRGEVRTMLLALKFIESHLIEKATGKKPIVLLDDVFSELDSTRQMALTKLQGHQIIITSTSPSGYSGEHVVRV